MDYNENNGYGGAPQMNEQQYGGYPQPPYYGQDGQQPQGNGNGGKGLAIASMVLGIIGVVFGCCVGALSILPGGVALGLGIAALVKKTDGRGMAIAGVVMGGVALLLALVWTTFVLSGSYSDMMEQIYNM